MARADGAGIEPLPVVRAADVETDIARPRWLVEGLWASEGVGVIGGAPKSCKTWLGLELSVSVATGTSALGRFAVVDSGPVLLYGAEDAAPRLRERLEALATCRNLSLGAIDVRLIVVPSLRLDTERDVARLRSTIEQNKPRLLVLDPLVRLHRIDENSAAEMSAMLGDLRAIQRDYALAVVLVHHLRKNGAAQEGQSLRGSGDLHAWTDSALYLRRRDDRLRLSIEHRAAQAPAPCELELATEPAAHLRLVEADPAAELKAEADLGAQIVTILGGGAELSRDDIRARTHSRNATLGEVLARLRAERVIERCGAGFRLRSDRVIPIPVPTTSTGDGNGNGNGNGASVVTKQRPSA